jgi:hypothetical protein
MLDAIGVEAFAERARRELAATGETARKRTVETSSELTAQIARLARDGLSNPEIGSRLFISARGPVPPGQGLRQARHQLAQPARPRPARRPGHCPAALAPPSRRLSPAWPGHDWPLALCAGGYERGPAGVTLAGRRPLAGEHLAGQAMDAYAGSRLEPSVEEELCPVSFL